jgi:hypothetical protein
LSDSERQRYLHDLNAATMAVMQLVLSDVFKNFQKAQSESPGWG